MSLADAFREAAWMLRYFLNGFLHGAPPLKMSSIGKQYNMAGIWKSDCVLFTYAETLASLDLVADADR